MTPALEGRHAMVTGGGRGIGAAIATALAAEGARVTLLGRDEARLNKTAGTLPIAQAVLCDVTIEASVDAAFDKATEDFGRRRSWSTTPARRNRRRSRAPRSSCSGACWT